MNNSIMVKCVLLGNENTGKSSIVYRYIDDTFNKEPGSTIGCSFYINKTKINNRNVNLNIWDTSGAERYRSLLPMYFRSAHVILICIDLSIYINEDLVEYWVNEIDNNIDINSKRIYIVGTKSDIKNEEYRNYLMKKLEIYPEFIYIETSAKNNINISKLFNSCMRMTIEVEERNRIKDNTISPFIVPTSEKNTKCFSHICFR